MNQRQRADGANRQQVFLERCRFSDFAQIVDEEILCFEQIVLSDHLGDFERSGVEVDS